MRKLCFLIALLYAGYGALAQDDCNHKNDVLGNFVLDTVSFERSEQPLFLKLVIDTSFEGNIWQIGAVQKTGFPAAHSGTQALQTDTLAPYPVNNESAASIYIDHTISQDGFASLSFWHYYDTDLLTDSCILQATLDSGKTWSNVFNQYFGTDHMIYYNGSLNNYQGTYQPGPYDSLFWSGKSNGWIKESICVLIRGAKGIKLPTIFGFRFLFHSDSIQNNKPGWMVDNIVVRDAAISPGVSERRKQGSAMVYPNPSSSGIFHIDYPSAYVKGTVHIYNHFGQLLQSAPLQKTVDISELMKGMYYYRIIFDGTGQVFSGSLLYD